MNIKFSNKKIIRLYAALTAVCAVTAPLSSVSFAEETVVYGDVTGDGRLTLDDITAGLRLYVNGADFDVSILKAADVNVNGALDMSDITLMLRKHTGYLDKFPAEIAPLAIARQGMFSSGGTVTVPVEGEYNSQINWLDAARPGNTAHVDHANVLYQIPVNDNGAPIVYLHGYGQSRMGWMTTPDGREGWSNIFLRNGHCAFLVDQPRRGEAGSTASMSHDGFLDAWAADSKDYKPGDQAWYTHFRIGRTAPEKYEGSQFPEGSDAQDQFFRQMTPNTGDFDMAVAAMALGEVMADVKKMTGKKSIFITHSQGGAVGWDVSAENISAVVAIEPGGTPVPGSEQYNKFLAAKIPIVIYFGDYIENGPEDIASTGFWKGVLDGARAFAEQYNKDGGDATVVYLPDEGITGNSHFMFQERNNQQIADHIEMWLAKHGLN